MFDFAPWLTVAKSEIGVQETPGTRSTPRVIEYHAATDLKATSDEVPWCSAFVCWCLEQCGIRSTRSAAARSYLRYGLRLKRPVLGAIAVMRRGKNPAQGHVGIYAGPSWVPGFFRCVGGNQGNAVSVARKSLGDVIAWVWPHDQPMPPDAELA